MKAALQVFAQSGFAETQMHQIAVAADLSKAALHFCFPSRDCLLDRLVERDALLPELPEMMAALGDTPPSLAMPTLIAEIWRLLRKRKELARVVSREVQSNAEQGRLLADHVGLPNYQSLADYLDRWMSRGVLIRHNALAITQYLIGVLWFFLLTQELPGGKDLYPLSDEMMVATVARMFLDKAATASEGLSVT
jgi:AcrR family transcriptional regulator